MLVYQRVINSCVFARQPFGQTATERAVAKKYPANENMVQGIVGSVHAQKSAGIKDIWVCLKIVYP